jgi:hypothetical protein
MIFSFKAYEDVYLGGWNLAYENYVFPIVQNFFSQASIPIMLNSEKGNFFCINRDLKLLVAYFPDQARKKILGIFPSLFEARKFIAPSYFNLPDIPLKWQEFSEEVHNLYEKNKLFWNEKNRIMGNDFPSTYFDSYDYLKPYNPNFESYICSVAQPYFTESGVALQKGVFTGWSTDQKTYLERDGEFLVVYYMERGIKNLIALFVDIKDAILFLTAHSLKLGSLPFDWDQAYTNFEAEHGPIVDGLILPAQDD